VRVPEDFAELSQRALESKYRGAKNTVEEWASRDGAFISVTAIPLSDMTGMPSDLAGVQKFLDLQFRNNPSFQVRKWKNQIIHGQEWRQVEAESSIDSKQYASVLAVTIVDSRMLSVTFNAAASRHDELLTVRDEFFRSLKVTCP